MKKLIDIAIALSIGGLILSYSAQRGLKTLITQRPGPYVYFATSGHFPHGRNYPDYVDFLNADRHPSPSRVPELIAVLQAGSTVQYLRQRETRRAMLELGSIGEAAAPAAPTLLRWLNLRGVLSTAELPYALLHIGSATAVGYGEVLPLLNQQGLDNAASVIQWLGPMGQDAAASMAPAFKGPRDLAWKAAVLTAFSPDPPKEVVSLLVAKLNDHDAPDLERQISINVLEKLGPSALSAVPPLIQALNEKSMATNAKIALEKIGAPDGIEAANRAFRLSRFQDTAWPIARGLSSWCWILLVPLLLIRCIRTLREPATAGLSFPKLFARSFIAGAIVVVVAAFYLPIPNRYDLKLSGKVVDDNGNSIPGALVGSVLVNRCGSLGGGSTSGPIAKFQTKVDSNGHFEHKVHGFYLGYVSLLTLSGCTPVENRYACKPGYSPTFEFNYLSPESMPHKGSFDAVFVLKPASEKRNDLPFMDIAKDGYECRER